MAIFQPQSLSDPRSLDDALELFSTSIDIFEEFIHEGALTLYSKIASNSYIQCERYFLKDIFENIINDGNYYFDGSELQELWRDIYDLENIPHTNNSMWITVRDLTKRWKVDEEDVIARLRSGELYSNRYEGGQYYDKVSPSNQYPLGSYHEISFHLARHIWPYEQKHPTLKREAHKYYNSVAEMYGKSPIYRSLRLPYELENNTPESGDGEAPLRQNTSAEFDKQIHDTTTQAATLARKRKNARSLVEKIGEAAKLAHAITVQGTKQGGLPWSEAEILALADELSVSIKGACLKAFKSGMPATLVKKAPGARPITPREESPDDVES